MQRWYKEDGKQIEGVAARRAWIFADPDVSWRISKKPYFFSDEVAFYKISQEILFAVQALKVTARSFHSLETQSPQRKVLFICRETSANENPQSRQERDMDCPKGRGFFLIAVSRSGKK